MRRQRMLLTAALTLALACFGCGASGTTDQAAENSGTEQTTQEVTEGEAVAESQEQRTLNAEGFEASFGGSFKPRVEPIESKELDKTETEEIDRAVRAYSAPEEPSLLVNNAKSFVTTRS